MPLCQASNTIHPYYKKAELTLLVVVPLPSFWESSGLSDSFSSESEFLHNLSPLTQ